MRVWCWELARRGAGPDWVLLASFAPGSEGALAGAAPPDGFAACPPAAGPCAEHGAGCAPRAFVDAASEEAYLANLDGSRPRNLYVYDLVELHLGGRAELRIECGYGGRGPELHAAETTLLLGILAAPGAALAEWRVLGGGEGYDFQTVGAGHGAESLRAYLEA